MAWLAMDADLEDHPKVHALMARRGWSADRCIAFLFRFWRTVRRHAEGGDITGWTDAYLGRQVNVARPVGLLADLVAVCLVDDCEGRRVVHGWMERNGNFLRGNATHEARAAGGRKGGATRAATGERDGAGRYKRAVGEVWPESGPDSNHTHQSEQCRSSTGAVQEPTNLPTCGGRAGAGTAGTATPPAGEEAEYPTAPPNTGGPEATTNGIPRSLRDEWLEAFHEDFWAEYPRRVGKPRATKAWLAMRPWTEAQVELVCAGLDRWLAHWRDAETQTQHIPHPATWLNDQRWNDTP